MELAADRVEARRLRSERNHASLNKLRSALNRIFENKLVDPGAIEDAVQETMMRLSVKMANSKSEINYDDTIALAIGIAKNVLKETLRNKASEQLSNRDGFFWASTTRDDLELEKSRAYEDSRYVASAMKELVLSLNERQQVIINESFSHSPKTAAEIASILGITPRTVQRIKAQALNRLRKEIGRGPRSRCDNLMQLLL